MSKKHDLDSWKLSIMVERGAIVIKGGDRLDERRWRKWKRLKTVWKRLSGKNENPSWKNVVSLRQFSRQRGREGHPCQLWTETSPPPPVFYYFLRSRPSSTASSSRTMALGSRRFFSSLGEDIPPPFHLSLSSSRLQNPPSFCPFTRGPFMPIALDKVFKAR